jgi:hypothetical protein
MGMRPRELQVDFINRSCAEFRGFPDLREVYRREFGRVPVYNTRTKSWVSTPAKVTDLAALLEMRGWSVSYSGAPATSSCQRDVDGPDQLDVSETVDPGRGLW